jgi:hypothetical protein
MTFQARDRVVAESESTERPARYGTVREVVHEDPHARYRIEWETGARASTRRRPARSSSRARPPSGLGDAQAPLSIVTASSSRTVTTTSGPVEVERQGRASRRRWGSAASGPKPGPAAAGASHDRRVNPGCERTDRSRLTMGVRFLLRCSPTLRPGC